MTRVTQIAGFRAFTFCSWGSAGEGGRTDLSK